MWERIHNHIIKYVKCQSEMMHVIFFVFSFISIEICKCLDNGIPYNMYLVWSLFSCPARDSVQYAIVYNDTALLQLYLLTEINTPLLQLYLIMQIDGFHRRARKITTWFIWTSCKQFTTLEKRCHHRRIWSRSVQS